MFASWSRGTLRLPEPPQWLCFPPTTTTTTTTMSPSPLSSVLVVVTRSWLLALLHTHRGEAELAAQLALAEEEPSSSAIEQAVRSLDRVYLLRSNHTIDVYELSSVKPSDDSASSSSSSNILLRALPTIRLSPQQPAITALCCPPPTLLSDHDDYAHSWHSTDHVLLMGNANGDVLLSDNKRARLVCRCFDDGGGGGVRDVKVQRNWLCATSSAGGELCLYSLPQGRAASKLPVPPGAVSATCFNQAGTVLAVGLANAPRVLLLSLNAQGGGAVHLLRTLVVFGPSLVEEELALGGVRQLCFGQEEDMLACLFEGRSEPTLFHTLSGRRTTTGSANISITPPARAQLGWAGRNNLYYSSSSSDGVLTRQGLCAHARQSSLLRNDYSRFALLGADYVSLLSLDDGDHSSSPPRFTRYDAPEEYCARFGPLSQLAVDDAGGDKIAVASAGGGFCVYFSQARRWRRFQSALLEERLVVRKMAWVPHSSLLLVVAEGGGGGGGGDEPGGGVRLDLLDLTDQRLDAPPLSSLWLSHAPIAVEFTGGGGDLVVLLLLMPTGVQVMRLDAYSARLTPDAHVRKPAQMLGALQHFCVVPSKSSHSVLPRCVLIDSHGCCAVVDLEAGQQGDVVLLATGGVADAWTKQDATLGVLVWTVVDAGLKLWVPALDPAGEIYFQPQGGGGGGMVDIGFSEVGSLPVGTDEDAFICLQAHSTGVVRASRSPVLHGVLGWLLRQKRDGLARRVLAERRFSKSSGLVRAALEDLLQGSLLGESYIEVGNVVNVLGCVPFEMMAAVVARCARQIDPELWDVLFSIVGQPRDLFHQCLVRFDANAAAMMRGNSELLVIAAELLPVVDADVNDPAHGPVRRAKQVLQRCSSRGRMQREVREYAAKRGLVLDAPPVAAPQQDIITNNGHGHDDGMDKEEEDALLLPEQGVVSSFFASFFT